MISQKSKLSNFILVFLQKYHKNYFETSEKDILDRFKIIY